VAIYALLMHPEVQGKVHLELDHIVGHDHPPRAEDRIRMPYLEAVWKESVRWRAPVPLSVSSLLYLPISIQADVSVEISLM
jgi:cytochrome P450